MNDIFYKLNLDKKMITRSPSRYIKREDVHPDLDERFRRLYEHVLDTKVSRLYFWSILREKAWGPYYTPNCLPIIKNENEKPIHISVPTLYANECKVKVTVHYPNKQMQVPLKLAEILVLVDPEITILDNI